MSSDADPLARIEEIVEEFRGEAEGVEDLDSLEELRARTLGRRRGSLTAVFESIGSLPAERRGEVGRAANQARQRIETRLEELGESLRGRLAGGRDSTFDVTLPGRRPELGTLHPLTLTLQEIETVFIRMGYQVVEGPEAEHDWYNFEALNIPPEHPARDDQDTLYLGGDWLLRTHTSPVQIRTMGAEEPPIAIIVPGRVYRRDTPDATHTPAFMQCEGLLVGRDVTMADLKGTLDHFARALFGPDTRTRLRPGYFPFTEPSGELDATCPGCSGDGCRVCKGSGWVELLGCGMVHPFVFESVGYDPEAVQGFAFGMGIDRIAAVRYGIDDIRLLYENDARFLDQFAA